MPDYRIEPPRHTRGEQLASAWDAVSGHVISLKGLWPTPADYAQLPRTWRRDLMAGLTVAQISDVHVGPTIRHGYLQRIVDTVNRLGADMVAVMLDAIDMARLLADPQAMIKGASELSKMLGFYEPEVKKVELTAPQMRNRTRLMAMSDEDLLRLIDEGEVMDVEFTEVQPSAH